MSKRRKMNSGFANFAKIKKNSEILIKKNMVISMILGAYCFVGCNTILPQKNEINVNVKKDINILWVGSSSTNSGIMNYTKEMLEEVGYNVKSRKAKAYFSMWKKNPDAESEILTEKYDKIIMQFSSWFLKYKKKEKRENAIKGSYDYAKFLCDMIRENGSEPIFFEHFVSGSILGKQKEASTIIRDVAKQNNADVAYCGVSFTNAYNKNKNKIEDFSTIFSHDNCHAGLMGNYIMACSVFITITEKSPVGLKFRPIHKDSKLTDNIAMKLQKIAWDEYKKTF